MPMSSNDTQGGGSKMGQKSVTYFFNGHTVKFLNITFCITVTIQLKKFQLANLLDGGWNN